MVTYISLILYGKCIGKYTVSSHGSDTIVGLFELGTQHLNHLHGEDTSGFSPKRWFVSFPTLSLWWN